MAKAAKTFYSPSQITSFLDSPFGAWWDRFAREQPHEAPERDPEDPLMAALAQKGYAHEDAMTAKFAQQGLEVVEIKSEKVADLARLTIEAMTKGADVICQGRLVLESEEDINLHGYSDFLVKVRGKSALGDYHYEIWDTKLSSTVKPSYLVQLCCYAEMLEAIQGIRPKHVAVALGDGSIERFATSDYYYYYLSVKQAFAKFQRQFDPSQPAKAADYILASGARWGNWSKLAEEQLLAEDHLYQVAGISQGQLKKLSTAGIHSMAQLASSTVGAVTGLSTGTFAKLKAQARIQTATKTQQLSAEGNKAASDQATPPDQAARPAYEVLPHERGDKMGLALLPPHSPEDVFFDIEGFPLDQGGLEYLWGASYFDEEGKRQFIDYWAHNHEQEQAAFKGFIEWAYAKWRKDPTMHIYHYASYEITACRKLMGRYGVCEHEVDQLLRNEVFVDLYKVVKGGILLGEPKYSIKNVEHLYRGKRTTDVGTGGDSVVVYDQWRQLHQAGEQGDTWQTSSILKSIRDYNIDDCDSTQELVDWLRGEQEQHGIAYLGGAPAAEEELIDEKSPITELRDALLARSESEDSIKAELTRNLAWLLEFHRRESKPMFWRMFERLGLTPDELADDLDCLANCERTGREPFKIKRSLGYEYRFDPTQEFKGAARQFYILGEETADGKSLKASWEKDESDLKAGLIVLKSTSPLPSSVTLIPDEYVNPRPIPEAIEATVRAYHEGQLQPAHSLARSAIVDLLTRARPRFRGPKGEDHTDIVTSTEPQERLQQIIEAAKSLDSSYLTIQGPPGAGKSYTGKHIIAALMEQGCKVGIASNSHKAINNLLLSTAQHCKAKGITASFACTKDSDPRLTDYDVAIVKNDKLASKVQPSCVLGTTAWGFAREDMAQQLDYLVVDEAGQVSVANLVAMSRSARNLILMGDQMQLGQPLQGTHPADSGLSVLDYLLKDQPTVKGDMGVFLATTYRMHSKVNRIISEQVYEGKLRSEPSNDVRVIDVPSDYPATGPLNLSAGLRFVPVEHSGNSQASDEEVVAIKTLVQDLIGRTFHQSSTESRTITLGDMLFVAPYNHQVTKLREALGPNAKVGSVDKFQGQEAPIVFLSMCASDPAQSPRGLEFLFDRHRLNVAVSRAQSLAIIVANPTIGRVPVSRVEQMKLINMFNGLLAEGAQQVREHQDFQTKLIRNRIA